jgi:hypothetical protein
MKQELRHLTLAPVVDKKKSPDYDVVRGYVPVELLKKFKFYCVERGVDNSIGLEEILTDFFRKRELQQNDPPASDTSAKGSRGKRKGKKGSEDE